VAVRCAHHGNLDALIGKSRDTSRPFSFDRRPSFEVKAELLKETNRQFEVIDDDSYVVQPFERHASNLKDVACMQQWTLCNQDGSRAIRKRRGLRQFSRPEGRYEIPVGMPTFHY
jgi:hypothetical protein